MLITPPYNSGVVESAGTWLPLAFVYLAGSLRKAGYEVVIYDAIYLKSGYIPTAWDLICWKDYSYKTKPGSTLAIVSSSRGCKQRCSFCSQQLFWQQSWRARTPKDFVRELEYLNQEFGVNVAMLSDKIPTLDRVRWEKILSLLIDKRMDLELLMETRVGDILRDEDLSPKYRDAGITHIYVGVESINQTILDLFQKELKVGQSRRAIELINQADIVSETSFVLGMPDETPENIDATVELAK
jgi:anaerobic magnesium-protoporphyrin IX monomethyl ester cyclase